MIDRDLLLGLVIVAVLSWANWAVVGYAVGAWAERHKAQQLAAEVAALEALAEASARRACLWEERYAAVAGARTADRLVGVSNGRH